MVHMTNMIQLKACGEVDESKLNNKQKKENTFWEVTLDFNCVHVLAG